MFCMVHNIKKINIFVRINNFNSISVKQIQHTMISLGFVDNNEKLENNVFRKIWKSFYNYVRVKCNLIITKIY